MPTYDYLCAACRHTFERFEPIGAGGVKTCPRCGKRKAKRRMGMGAGLIFKGSGFYVTDYKNASGPKKPESSDKSEAPKSEASKSEAPKAETAKSDAKTTKEKEPKK